jgi:hypothetical protein
LIHPDDKIKTIEAQKKPIDSKNQFTLPIELFIKKTILYGLKSLWRYYLKWKKSHLLKVYLLISQKEKQAETIVKEKNLPKQQKLNPIF